MADRTDDRQLDLWLDPSARGSGGSTPGFVADPTEPSVAGPAEELLQKLRAFGASVQRLVLTENRRTMVSWTGPRRGILRLHARFSEADAKVVRAVADFVTFGRGPRRAAAIREIRAFVRAFPAVAPEPRRRRVGPQDRPHVERLAAEFARVNERYFEGRLPVVPILLSGRMRSRNGHFSTRPLEIVISRRLCVHALPGEAEHTLRHEMIHLWQHVAGVRIGHGREFRQWARTLDVHPRARRGVVWKTERPR